MYKKLTLAICAMFILQSTQLADASAIAILALPTISEISPVEGPVGTTVTLQGKNFGELDTIYFIRKDGDAGDRWELKTNTWTGKVTKIISKTDTKLVFVAPPIQCPPDSDQSGQLCNQLGDYAVRVKTNDGVGNRVIFRLTASSQDEPKPTIQKAGTVKGIKVSASDVKAKDYIKNKDVPGVVERIFSDVFGRKITPTESTYWKQRARYDKPTEGKLRGAMAWHKGHGSIGVKSQPVAGAKSIVSGASLMSRINALFRSVYSRNPSVSENHYWLTRISDKPTEAAMIGAMIHHKIHNISH